MRELVDAMMGGGQPAPQQQPPAPQPQPPAAMPAQGQGQGNVIPAMIQQLQAINPQMAQEVMGVIQKYMGGR